MTVKELYNKLGQLMESGQITGEEEFGLWDCSYEGEGEGYDFWSPDELKISDDYTRVELT